jgi:hypothetical protein
VNKSCHYLSALCASERFSASASLDTLQFARSQSERVALVESRRVENSRLNLFFSENTFQES